MEQRKWMRSMRNGKGGWELKETSWQAAEEEKQRAEERN